MNFLLVYSKSKMCKSFKMMSSNVALLHSNNCCVLEPAICEDLDLHVVIYSIILSDIRKHNRRSDVKLHNILFFLFFIKKEKMK